MIKRTVNASFLGDLSYVSQFDDALDTAHADFDHAQYKLTRDEKHIPLKDGAKPARFLLKPLSLADREELEALSGGERFAMACRMALKSCSGFTFVDGDGREVEVKIQLEHGRVTRETLDYLGHHLTQEIGQVACAHAALSERFS